VFFATHCSVFCNTLQRFLQHTKVLFCHTLHYAITSELELWDMVSQGVRMSAEGGCYIGIWIPTIQITLFWAAEERAREYCLFYRTLLQKRPLILRTSFLSHLCFAQSHSHERESESVTELNRDERESGGVLVNLKGNIDKMDLLVVRSYNVARS